MMEPTFRLDSASPKLAEMIRKASPAKCRQAAIVACELAAASAGLVDQEVALAFDTLRRGTSVPISLQQRLEQLAAQYDAEYLCLDEEGDESKRSETLRLFSKARATSALAYALSENALFHEAIYEAMAALSNPDELEKATERALR